MKIKKSLLEKIAAVFLGALICAILTGCPPVCPQNIFITGTVVGDMDGDGEMEKIPGIQFTLESLPGKIDHTGYSEDFDNEESDDFIYYTPEYNFYFHWTLSFQKESIKLTLKDVDGEKNGSFKTKTVKVEFTPEDYEKKLGIIELEKK